jgi:acylphosphatase
MMCEWLIRVEGNVQGVGFRSTVRRLAEIHHIFGFVRNCSDGSVEICAQAHEKNLEGFLENVRMRPGIGSIDQIKIERRSPDMIFSSFTIQ